jgi:hypothetical protein
VHDSGDIVTTVSGVLESLTYIVATRDQLPQENMNRGDRPKPTTEFDISVSDDVTRSVFVNSHTDNNAPTDAQTLAREVGMLQQVRLAMEERHQRQKIYLYN